MISGFYEWMKNITYCLIVFIALIQVLPDHGYRKYVRFFTGLVLVLLICTPVMKLLDADENFSAIYQENQAQLESEELRESEDLLEEIEDAQIVPEEYQGEVASEEESETEGRIHVEEIQIGR